MWRERFPSHPIQQPIAFADGIDADPTDHDLISLNLFRRKVARSAAAAAFLIAKMNMYQLSRLVERARV